MTAKINGRCIITNLRISVFIFIFAKLNRKDAPLSRLL